MSRKRKKEDRAKTQFKKPKTAPGRHLPKGTNETRTEFKVAQIVIPGQRGEAASPSSGPRTSKKLGLKDVLGKLGHFSQSVRSDGVQGLKELVVVSGLISSNLARVLDCLVPLCQDKERKIRQETVALLGSVLRQVSPAQLSPFHPLLAAHLACCLTNIDPRVQQEGLDLLDSLMEAAPSFIVSQYQAIVPNCLDQISNKKTTTKTTTTMSTTTKGPKVAANLSEKVTAIQWRLSVLSRVARILELATTRQQEEEEDVTKAGVEQDHRPGRHYGLLRREAAGLSLASVTREQQESSVGDIVQLVVPLMVETWVEARADESSQTKTSALTSESSSLLLSIAGILDRLLALVTGLEVTERERVVEMIRLKHLPDIRLHLLSSLPYTGPSTTIPRSNALLCLVSLALETAPSSSSLATAVTVCERRQAGLEVRLRLAGRLLAEDLTETQREVLVSSLASLAREEDSLEVWRLLGREVLTRPGPALTSWVSSLPALVLHQRATLRLRLLELCLEISKTDNCSALAGLSTTDTWGQIQASVSQEHQEEEGDGGDGGGGGVTARMMRTLGFIQHHCTRVTTAA